jgi:hypothetical protein
VLVAEFLAGRKKKSLAGSAMQFCFPARQDKFEIATFVSGKISSPPPPLPAREIKTNIFGQRSKTTSSQLKDDGMEN